MGGSIAGRDAELASLRDFVASLSDGAAALVLEGEAGMGKTTLWSAGIEHAQDRGLRVLEARPAESETTLSFSAIGDLFDRVLDEVLASLPAGQKRALSRALVLEGDEGPPPDAHAVGMALLNVLRALATEGPVVVAVDDVQWLDPASSGGLSYAARRLRDEHVGLLLARRSGHDSALPDELRRALPAERVTDMEVGPLGAGALRQVVHARIGVLLPRPLLAEVREAAGGNPFYALEIVRTLQRTGASVEAGQPLPVPDSLHDLVHERLLALPRESREFLVAAAAYAHPTILLTEAASGVDRDAGLVPALEARIVEVDADRIRFTHPLLAAGAYETADSRRRSEIHGRLADLLEDPEARAWQLCASVERADEQVAGVLEDAAQHARARGAPRPAALLLDRASKLTPDDRGDDKIRRAVEGAYLHYESGDSLRAEKQLREVIADLPPGHERARALTRLARVRAYVALADAADLFLRAVAEAEGDTEVLAVAHEGVATCWFRLYERLPEAVEHAELAAGFALEIDRPALAAECLATRWTIELLLGREFEETLGRALSLQAATENLRVLAQPRFASAAAQLWLKASLQESRDELLALLGRAGELGDESSPPLVLAHLGEVECELGQLDAALAHAVEGREAASQAGQDTVLAHNHAVEALVAAQHGDAERARELALRTLELAPGTAGRQAEFVATRALGHLELSLGAPEAAVEALARLVAFVREQGIAEPGLAPFAVDLVEALIELGRRDEAVELLDWYEGNARRLGRDAALAASLRCRGLLAAQTGAVDEALAAYAEALEWHAQAELPLDHGRTLLALGAAQRRAKRRREARQTLEQALALFERIGAALWAGRARSELRRISGRAPAAGELTPAEERVAALVCEGKTNREVAAALYLSDRTVEGHLSRIFGKLGIAHRNQLGPALALRQTQGISASNTGDSPVSADPVAP